MSKPPKIDKNLVSNLRQARRIYACNCLLRAVASQPWPLGESSHKPSHTYLFTRFLHSFSSTCISHVTHSKHNGTTVISTCMYSRVAAGCEKCYGIFSLGVPLAVLGLHGSCSIGRPTQQPVELPEKCLQNLFHNLPSQSLGFVNVLLRTRNTTRIRCRLCWIQSGFK